ncbi:hypothetical protein KL86PLE_100308 [uncultured Pleomorphomonas sp.]|uniref:Uncharacterized protein n=1 Tax=uncultured Pleomorphomonas sp. TaxID=442121 RepID=A0A212L2V6_9HYPH|nr:hypothetical protein [uncultured Pleomorphomonas sp.]SCM71689.1 hypothetical protein KL86PLE_100308 [uncultured Pleomorphomonas sp.]
MYGAEPNKQSVDRIKTKVIDQLCDEDRHEAIVALVMVLAGLVIMTSRSSSSADRWVDEISVSLRKFVDAVKRPETRQ